MLNFKKTAIILVHAFIGWALCGSIIGVGRIYLTMDNTLIVHALGVPVIFAIISLIYFKFFNYTSPLKTASIFTGSAILLDLLIVVPFVEKSFDMFLSPIGTWIPFALIFAATYLTGKAIRKSRA
jgi:hypothetical protein